ncbi:MAG: c-type cytochrome [Verrucomicrobia bacterium]|jgi:putative heme-binding domain-containing protein|nr:c-type cytochrome [Verrucomicrobiota bacterium]
MRKEHHPRVRSGMLRLRMLTTIAAAVLASLPVNAQRGRGPDPNRGAAIGENKATPVDRIKVLPGFEVELLYSVPNSDLGSWVALAANSRGTIYASDQYGALYRFDTPAPGKTLSREDIQKVPVDIRAINGMIFVDDVLYAGVNDYERKIQSGLYRITDSDGDGELDKADLLQAFQSRGDHGVHAVLPTPDGKYFYLITGNNAIISPGYKEATSDQSPVAKIWGDDHLLSRMPDGRGHNRDVLAPGGIVYRVSRDGKEFEIYASGFRNIYGGGINKDGELFAYDADMEYDFNTPWYRPTRVNHVVSGAEFGWRNGAGKYPDFYAETLPAPINIGPGSPTGTRFGYGAKFPRKYQEAFYILDWSWGKIYAVHLEEDGASYKGTKEEFVTGAPLPVTDVIIHPRDGAMYFAIGGRRVQSGLYRVRYTGKENTAPADMTPHITPLRKLRHSLEAYHGKQDSKAIDAAWPHLDHADRFIRAAARVVLEHQPVDRWASKALSEPTAGKRIPALLALARTTGVSPSHRPETGYTVDTGMRNKLLNSLLDLNFNALSQTEKMDYVRTMQIILIRFDEPSQDKVNAIIAKLDPAFPAATFELNWLLCETLAYLQSPNTAAKGMALIAEAESQEPQMQYARSLRFLKTGWTSELRKQQLEWFLKAANYRGGASFERFISFIKQDSLATFTEAELKEHAELIAREPEQKSVIENLGEMFAGRTPKMWTLEELSAATKTGLKHRNFENGRKMFSAAACFACHRFGNAGGMNGPDLTAAAGKFNPHDLLDNILNPSKVISDQFVPIVVTMEDGDTVTGIVVNLNGDSVSINTDLTNPNQRTNIDRRKVSSIEVSDVSPMPQGLLAALTKEEILDLCAYILSGGDKTDAMFKN